jgi:vesicle-fusing ATPase
MSTDKKFKNSKIELTVTEGKKTFDTYGYVNNKTFLTINSDKSDIVMLMGDNHVIINIKIDDTLQDNYISLSSQTRKMCGYCLETNNLFDYVNSTTSYPLLLQKVIFTISSFGSSNLSEIKNIDCVEVNTKLKKLLLNSSINIGHVLVFLINDYKVRLTIDKFIFYNDNLIETVEIEKMEKEHKTNGFVCETTEYNFNKGTNVKLLNKKSSDNNQIFNTNFDFKELDIGGMEKELATILRRVFISRVLPSDIITKLNISHVKGLIMYGPPGTGKTLIARQLSKCLKAKSIKIINGPELLSKWLGETEKKIRELFDEAENDQKSGEEGLHVIIFDEFDSVAIKRGSVDGISGDVNNKVVTQLLSKIDGVDSLNNILLIGMTNRLDMLDPAILRPGRFEVHIEIALPDEAGRHEILEIHTKNLYKEKCISQEVNLLELASLTKNYTGAELEGLVREARSYAINQIVDLKNLSKKIEINNVLVSREHFIRAINNYSPKFGTSTDNLDYYLQNGIVNYSDEFIKMNDSTCNFIDIFRENNKKMLSSIGIYGCSGSGKTAFSVWLAKYSKFPYIKIISNNDIAGYSESAKNNYIKDVFEQGYLSQLSVIIIDSVDTIIEYYRDEITGTLRFMNSVYNVLKTYIKKNPTKLNHKMLIIFNTEFMSGFDFNKYLDINIEMPLVIKNGVSIPIKLTY